MLLKILIGILAVAAWFIGVMLIGSVARDFFKEWLPPDRRK